jgi:hypothetical protein
MNIHFSTCCFISDLAAAKLAGSKIKTENQTSVLECHHGHFHISSQQPMAQ